MNIGDNMEKYTFEQIVNEKTREYEEIRKECNSFKNLVTYNTSKYDFNGTYMLVDSGDFILYYKRTDEKLYNKIYNKIISRTPFMVYGRNSIWFMGMDNLKKEYVDSKGNLIFTINNIDDFKEKYYELTSSVLYKELSTGERSATRIKGDDGITILALSGGLVETLQCDEKLLFNPGDHATFSGVNTNAVKMFNKYMHMRYDISNLSEYFQENIEKNKDTFLPFEFDEKFVPHTYKLSKYDELEHETFNIEKEEKRYSLHKLTK